MALTVADVLQALPRTLFIEKFTRSGKPGGQHVNTTNTKALIALPLASMRAAPLPPSVRAALLSSRFRYRTRTGLLVSSERTRSQQQNLRDCYEKLAQAVCELDTPPREPDAAAVAKWAALRRAQEANTRRRKQLHADKKADRRV